MRKLHPDRVRRHMLGIGPPPQYRMSKVIRKQDLDVVVPRLVKGWVKAVPHKDTEARAQVEEVDDHDYLRYSIYFVIDL